MSTTTEQSSPAAAPLIGVAGLAPPRWASVDAQVAAAGVWRTVRSLPRSGWCGGAGGIYQELFDIQAGAYAHDHL